MWPRRIQFRRSASTQGGTLTRDSRKAVCLPLFTAYAVMHEEETGAIVPLLHRSESFVVLSPVSALPFAVEVITFRNIRSGIGNNLAQLGSS